MAIEDNENRLIQSPSLKLTRNSKGYTWEIKILGLDIAQLETLNNQMLEKFGGAVE